MYGLAYDNDDYDLYVDGELYHCNVSATAEVEHMPGTMYTRNGDPGDPPEDYFNILSCSVTDIMDDDGVPVDDQEIVQKVYDTVYDELESSEDLFDFVEVDEC